MPGRVALERRPRFLARHGPPWSNPLRRPAAATRFRQPGSPVRRRSPGRSAGRRSAGHPAIRRRGGAAAARGSSRSAAEHRRALHRSSSCSKASATFVIDPDADPMRSAAGMGTRRCGLQSRAHQAVDGQAYVQCRARDRSCSPARTVGQRDRQSACADDGVNMRTPKASAADDRLAARPAGAAPAPRPGGRRRPRTAAGPAVRASGPPASIASSTAASGSAITSTGPIARAVVSQCGFSRSADQPRMSSASTLCTIVDRSPSPTRERQPALDDRVELARLATLLEERLVVGEQSPLGARGKRRQRPFAQPAEHTDRSERDGLAGPCPPGPAVTTAPPPAASATGPRPR